MRGIRCHSSVSRRPTAVCSTAEITNARCTIVSSDSLISPSLGTLLAAPSVSSGGFSFDKLNDAVLRLDSTRC